MEHFIICSVGCRVQYLKLFEYGKFTFPIFIDFSENFDTVDHSILLNQLSKYDIKDKNWYWFKSHGWL